MTRPHIDFIQSQALAWERSPWPHLSGCQVKLLSLDPAGGAASALVRYPAGWTGTASGYLGAGEELLVIDGSLDLDGRRYHQDCYGWFPAGTLQRSRSAADGAVALTFFDREPAWTDGPAPAGVHDLAGAVEFRDAYAMHWSEPYAGPPYEASGLRWKLLRGNPASGSSTMLITCPPHTHPAAWLGPQEVHDCSEELYVLAGDVLCNIGMMVNGGYVWRPPEVPHGPYASRGGCLLLMRTCGAALLHHRTPHEVAISRSPSYQPVLPPSLGSLRTRLWRPQRY